MSRPKQTARQRRATKVRSEYLESANRWRRVGTEELEDEVVLTRISRKPPAWRLERYLCVGAETKKLVAILEKAPKGESGWFIIAPNEDGEPRALRCKTRRLAIQGFLKLGPVREEPVEETDGQG